jgi:chemotaxis family two-component system sensor kinase Cph1
MRSKPTVEEVQPPGPSLDGSEKENQRFLDHLVHDLRSARRAVGISMEVLLARLSPPPNEELQETVRRMQRGLAQMDAILSGIGAYSLSLRASAYSFGLVPAEMVLRLAMADLARDVVEAGATITFDRLPRVWGDTGRLTNLFRNLIDNALKYRGQEAPQIKIQAKQDQGNWLFSVQDNGVGIDQKYWDSILTPFSRLHGPEIPGVGLGLAICKKILEAHRGTIWVESTAGRGATFFFTLPAEDAA